jgi:predicted metal-dependent HD superfamily phosphohydrolase
MGEESEFRALIDDAEVAALRAAYGERHRHYHTWTHVESLLAAARRDAMATPAILLAIAYHDVVYSPTAKDNEAQSANALFAAWQRKAVHADEATVRHAMGMINLGTGDAQADWFWDADREILAAAREAYQAYAAAVRKEYKIYPDFMYRRGRAQFLQGELARPKIFRTDSFNARFGDAARANLAAELDALR